MMLGLDEKHPISTAHYERQGICLECHHLHPKPNSGGLTEMKSSIPLWQEDATGVCWVSAVPQHFTALHFQLQPYTSSLHSFGTMDFWFLKQQENQFWELLLLCKTKFIQKPNKQRDISPNFHTCPGQLDLVSAVLRTSKWPRDLVSACFEYQGFEYL